MLEKDLAKHAREFSGYINKGNYEECESGLLFPRAGVKVFGEYAHSVNGEDERTDANLLPVEGLNSLLNVALGSGTKYAGWFLALFSGSYTPTGNEIAATFPSIATEITSNLEGYSETTRRPWQPATPAAGAIDNLTTKATFTIVTASTVTIRGAALLSESAKGSINGNLVSISRFGADRVQYNTDVFSLGYRVRLQST